MVCWYGRLGSLDVHKMLVLAVFQVYFWLLALVRSAWLATDTVAFDALRRNDAPAFVKLHATQGTPYTAPSPTPPPTPSTTPSPTPCVALVHGTSRADKQWPIEHWQALGARLNVAGYTVALPHGSDAEQRTCEAIASPLKSAVVWPRLGLDALTDALANRTDGAGYEAPTRWLADVAVPIAAHTPAVQRSRELCARALGYFLPKNESFGLVALVPGAWVATNNIAFVEMRGNDVRALVNQHATPGTLCAAPSTTPSPARSPVPCIALIHGTSRADKQWPLEHWQALGARLNAAGCAVALAHGSDAEQRTSEAIASKLESAVVWPRLGLDAMTDALAKCAGVIGVDSGLSHIAVALDLPHVQIYNFDTAWRTGPQHSARQVSVFAQPAPTVDAVWQAWLGVCLPVLQPVAGRSD